MEHDLLGRSNWKVSGSNERPEEIVLFSRSKCSKTGIVIHFFKRIFDTSFKGKHDYRTKSTRPEFCLPFAQTVNRPFCPSTCIHGKQPANTNVVKSTTNSSNISWNAWVGEHFTLEGCVPEATQHWKNLSNTSQFQAKPSKDNPKTHSLQFHDPRSFCAGLIYLFVTVNMKHLTAARRIFQHSSRCFIWWWNTTSHAWYITVKLFGLRLMNHLN